MWILGLSGGPQVEGAQAGCDALQRHLDRHRRHGRAPGQGRPVDHRVPERRRRDPGGDHRGAVAAAVPAARTRRGLGRRRPAARRHGRGASRSRTPSPRPSASPAPPSTGATTRRAAAPAAPTAASAASRSRAARCCPARKPTSCPRATAWSPKCPAAAATARRPERAGSPAHRLPADGGRARRSRAGSASRRASTSWRRSRRARSATPRLLGKRIYFVNDAEYVKRILLDNLANYPKSVTYRNNLRPFLGDGLLISEGDFWKRQRRLAQPAFHLRRLKALAAAMAECAGAHGAGWEHGKVIDVMAAMNAVTMEIVAHDAVRRRRERRHRRGGRGDDRAGRGNRPHPARPRSSTCPSSSRGRAAGASPRRWRRSTPSSTASSPQRRAESTGEAPRTTCCRCCSKRATRKPARA